MHSKRLELNKEAALEGLPLYLIILVVIAGISTAVIAGWMMSSQTTELGSIEVDSEDRIVSTNPGQSITVRAYDQSGNPLEGAVVTLEGCEVQEAGQTDGEGECTLRNINPNLPENENFGTIDVTVTYTGDVSMTKRATITVEA
ncbi:MAG: carboxypeptidase-like regulatory domain-containing protein [Thermoplasmatota archaeon]